MLQLILCTKPYLFLLENVRVKCINLVEKEIQEKMYIENYKKFLSDGHLLAYPYRQEPEKTHCGALKMRSGECNKPKILRKIDLGVPGYPENS